MDPHIKSDHQLFVATFRDATSARDAVARLKDAGFDHPWVGVTQIADRSSETYQSYGRDNAGAYQRDFGTTQTSFTAKKTGTSISEHVVSEESGSDMMGAIGRFFSGESHGQPLLEALQHRGLDVASAAQVDEAVPDNGAVLTVQAKPENGSSVRAIIEGCGGTLTQTGAYAGSKSTNTTTGTTYDSSADKKLSEQQRIQLNEERLKVGTTKESLGEATIRKEVITETQRIDVPVTREELFIERRPTRDRVGGTIGNASETIRIPLSQEHVNVTKDVIATEDVLAGKRSITETQSVNESVRHEELRTADVAKKNLPPDPKLN